MLELTNTILKSGSSLNEFSVNEPLVLSHNLNFNFFSTHSYKECKKSSNNYLLNRLHQKRSNYDYATIVTFV